MWKLGCTPAGVGSSLKISWQPASQWVMGSETLIVRLCCQGLFSPSSRGVSGKAHHKCLLSQVPFLLRYVSCSSQYMKTLKHLVWALCTGVLTFDPLAMLHTAYPTFPLVWPLADALPTVIALLLVASERTGSTRQ